MNPENVGKTGEISTDIETSPTQERTNELDEMLEDGDFSPEERFELLNKLGKMCSQLKTIPDSMHIERCYNSPTDGGLIGGSSTVSRGRFRGRVVAIKTLKVYLTSDFNECFCKFRREVIAWGYLRHPHILPLIGVNLEQHRFVMVSEWMDHGNINEFVRNCEGVNRPQLVNATHPNNVEITDSFSQLADAANGLEYMHSIDMVHGDLKGANILINNNLRACLADFGLSTVVCVGGRNGNNTSPIVASKPSLMSFTAGGSARWMSPELHDPEQFGVTDSRPTKQSDCYALGMVIYEVLSGNIPYHDIINVGAVMDAIMRGDRPQAPEGAEELGFTKGLWKIVQRCWLVDTILRPDVKDILSQLNHASWSWDRRQSI